MKIIATTGLIIISMLTHAQENQKAAKESNTTKQTAQTNRLTAYLGNYSGSVSIAKNELTKMDNLMVRSKDSKATFTVLGFEITGTVQGQTMIATCLGSTLCPDAKAIMSGAKVGSKVFIDQIKVKSSDGKITNNATGITILVK
ncbi:MAG TPA: GldM family protein [Bacteroidia bacterium]